jgi:hypothetical protein
MKTKPFISGVVCLCLAASVHAFDLFNALESAGATDITAVASRKAKGYVRVQLGDGSFVPETYVFGPGGVWHGDKVDDTIDKLKFLDVAHMIAGPLASQNYIPGTDPRTTKLLIMVYWGTSHGVEKASESNGYVNLQSANTEMNREVPMAQQKDKFGRMKNLEGQPAFDAVTVAIAAVQAENRLRDLDDHINVMMLGYDSWWEGTDRYKFSPMDFRRQDLLDEIEEDRYFVVLMAYDLESIRKRNSHRLLWETRFSIRERHHAFNEDLPAMAQYASRYFGQDSHGLVHEEVRMGHVDIGDVRSLGEVPSKSNEESHSSEKQ